MLERSLHEPPSHAPPMRPSQPDDTFRFAGIGPLRNTLPFLLAAAVAAQGPFLGSASGFAVLGGQSVTNTGTSVIIGDVGVAPGTAFGGFRGMLTGYLHLCDAVALQAQVDVAGAYDALLGTACTTSMTGQDLGGLTLTPGVYCFATEAQLTGTLTLDALGDAAAIFVFQTDSSFTTAVAASVILVNGTDANNVFWQVGGSATIGATTVFAGSVLALASITLNQGASLTGRALARSGAVIMDSDSVALPGAALAQYFTFAQGCAGSLGVTSLVAVAPPRVGQLMSVVLDHLPQDLAILIAGYSNAVSSFGPLPLELSGLGMPGCHACVAPDVCLALSGAGGTATYGCVIPNDVALLGLRFHQQALVIDSSAGNALGAVMSDAATAVVGN